MKSFYITDSGRVRSHNEDSVTIVKNTSSEHLMIVADGMGGHRAGEIASSMVVTQIGFLMFVNIGDSSGFVFKNGKLKKITNDHTLVNFLVETGDLSEREAKNHPKRNVLMRALGAADTCEFDIFDVETDVDAIMLSSDGLTNMLTQEQIEKVLNEEDISVEDTLIKLVKKCNVRGGQDNISIAYLVKEDRSGDV